METKLAEELIRGFSLKDVKAAIEINKNNYLNTYRSLLELAKRTSDHDKHDDGLRALALATYGWMPTIMKCDDLKRFNCDNPVQSIKAIKTPNEAYAFIRSMCKDAPVNNSWIGTSKLLHFLNPNFFPIWDSRIAVIFGFTTYRYNKWDVYLEYTQFMHNQAAKFGSRFCGMAALIDDTYGYTPSDIRCIEFFLFTVSVREAESEKNL